MHQFPHVLKPHDLLCLYLTAGCPRGVSDVNSYRGPVSISLPLLFPPSCNLCQAGLIGYRFRVRRGSLPWTTPVQAYLVRCNDKQAALRV